MVVRRFLNESEPVATLSASTPDRDLTLAFQRGDKGAYQEIYDRYSSNVHGVCRRILVNREDAAEAAQETFLRIYQGLGRFNGQYQLGAWITRIATNVCLDQLRAKGRKGKELFAIEIEDLESSTDVDDGPEGVVERKAESRRVRRILESLPPMHRAAIALRDFEGLSYEETAAALGITQPQVKALLHRARQGFKRSWVSAGLAAFLPTRLFYRFRAVRVAKETAGQSLAAAIPAAPACGTALQQCGQYLAAKVAPVLTLAMVGASAVGTPSAQAPVSRPAPDARFAKPSAFLDSKVPPRRAAMPASSDKRSAPKTDPADDLPPVQGPATDPGTEPEAPATDPAAPPPSEQPDPTGTTAPPPAEGRTPAPSRTTSIGFDWGSGVPWLEPASSTTSMECGHMAVRQEMEIFVTDSAGTYYPATLSVTTGPRDGSSHFDFQLKVWSDEATFTYSGSGTLTSLSGEGSMVTGHWRGRYSVVGGAGSMPQFPQSGHFTARLQLDCAAQSVVTESIALDTGSSR